MKHIILAMSISILLLMTYAMYKFIVVFVNVVGVEKSVMMFLSLLAVFGLASMIQENK